MLLGAFSVFDSKAKSFGQPFYAVNAAVACRMIEEALSDTSHQFSRFAEDYTLFQLAQFDDSTGAFVFEEGSALVNLGPLVSFKKVSV